MHSARVTLLSLLCTLLLYAATPMQGQLTDAQTPASQTSASASSLAAQQADSPEPQSAQTSTAEDWNTISLAKSGLRLDATGATVLGKSDKDGCTRERLRLQWRANDPIDLFLIRPSGTQKIPAVLFLYNYNYEEEVFEKDHWCDVALRNGFAVVGMPSALSWSRIRPPRPLKEWFVSELQEALASSTHDVQMVINALTARGDLDMRQVGIFGEGSGGAVAILAAAADPRIAVLDLMNPWGDWPDWLKDSKQIPETERADYLKPEFLARVSALDPIDYLPQLKGRSVHIQQVLDDPITPSAARDRIDSVAPPASVTRYASVVEEAKSLGKDGIVGWMGKQLQALQQGGSAQQADLGSTRATTSK